MRSFFVTGRFCIVYGLAVWFIDMLRIFKCDMRWCALRFSESVQNFIGRFQVEQFTLITLVFLEKAMIVALRPDLVVFAGRRIVNVRVVF